MASTDPDDASTGSGRRVLLVDDAPEVRMLLELVLQLDGFVVLLAEDGPSGLTAARDGSPDLVLLDVQMPGLDGPDVLRALRADPRTSALPVVFLTGEPASHDAGLLALGARAVLRKPVDPATVAADLSALL